MHQHDRRTQVPDADGLLAAALRHAATGGALGALLLHLDSTIRSGGQIPARWRPF